MRVMSMSDESVETVGKPRGGALKYILFFVVGMLQKRGNCMITLLQLCCH